MSRGRRVTKEVNASVQGMQTTGSEAIVDCVRAQAAVDKLATRHDPVLARGHLGDRPLAGANRADSTTRVGPGGTVVVFAANMGANATRTPRAPCACGAVGAVRA
jgi:hypothetical protein